MDSSEGHSDASDGSGSGRETKRTNRTGSSHDKGPKWACTKPTFPDWLWEMEQVWDAVGLHHTYTGQNRDDAQSSDSRVRKRYAKSNRKVALSEYYQTAGQGYHPGKSNEADDKG